MPLVQRQPAEIEPEVEPVVDEPTDDAVATTGLVQRTVAPPRQPAAPIVQRQTANPIDTAELVEPSGGEATIAPQAVVDGYAPLDLPLAQRQPVESQISAQPSIAQFDGAPPPRFDLSERILSRVVPSERRAAVAPVELPLHRAPVQPESRPAAITASHVTASERSSTSGAAPAIASSAAPVIQRTIEPAIQRTPIESAASSADTDFFQRVDTVPETAAQQPEATAAVDLDRLARQVYPLIKRLIAIERERRAFR
jgi:hypothetical protein